MARARRRTGFKKFPKRVGLWIPFEVTIALTTAGSITNSNDLLANYFGQTGEEVPTGSTIGPVRGRLGVRPTASATFAVNNKIEIVLQLNKEGGRAVPPVPGVDILDAMWYGQVFVNGRIEEISAGVFNQQWTMQDFSTKSMRKITGNGQVLILSAVQDTNTDYTVVYIGSVFMRLP